MKIQIMQIFKESFKHVRGHMLEWLRVAYAPIVVFFVGLFITMILYIAAGVPPQAVITGKVNGVNLYEVVPPGELLLVIVGNVIYFVTHLIASLSLYINGFRYGALNEGGNRWWTLQLNMRFVKMILYSILLGIFVALYVLLAIGIIAGVGILVKSLALDIILGIFLGIYGFYMLVRLGLLFFLIAIDRSEPLKTSWRLLKGNVLRFIGLMLLVALSILGITAIGMAVLGLIWMFSATISTVLAVIAGILFILFGAFMWFIYWAVMSKATAGVYKTFTEGTVF